VQAAKQEASSISILLSKAITFSLIKIFG